MSNPIRVLAFAAYRFVVIAMMVSMCSASDLISTNLINEQGVNSLAPRNLVIRGLPAADGGPAEPVGDGAPPPDSPPPIPPGGQFPVDTEDPYIKALACWAVYHKDNDTSSIYQQRPVRLVSAFQQVEDRNVYELRMTVGTTDCLKGQNCVEPVQLLHCATGIRDDNYRPLICNAKIWGDEPWLDENVLIKNWCSEISFDSLNI